MNQGTPKLYLTVLSLDWSRMHKTVGNFCFFHYQLVNDFVHNCRKPSTFHLIKDLNNDSHLFYSDFNYWILISNFSLDIFVSQSVDFCTKWPWKFRFVGTFFRWAYIYRTCGILASQSARRHIGHLAFSSAKWIAMLFKLAHEHLPVDTYSNRCKHRLWECLLCNEPQCQL